MPPRPDHLARFAAHALFLAAFLSLQLCPARANAFIFGGVSIKDEQEMGQKFDAMLRSRMAVIDDPEVSQYISGILERLTKNLPPQPFSFRASVILHNSLNAFAVPGGFVYVFTGMIMNVSREDELAGVLAHELAHVTQRHVASRLERAQYVTVASLLLAVAGVALGGSGGSGLAAGALGAGQSAMLNYSRIDETEADHQGLQYLIAAGYPPGGMVGGFKVLRQKSWMSGTNVPTYLSTHPAIGERINSLQARIQGLPASVRNRRLDNSRFRRVNILLWARYGDPQAALQRFSEAGALPAMGRGIVLARQNNVSAASQAFEQAVNAAPADPLVLREAGIFHFRKGNMQKAAELLEKALRLDPRDYMTSFFYARMLDESGQQARAERYYEEVLLRVPEDAEVREAYARSLGRRGRTFDAYLQMTYGALYANDQKKADLYFKRTGDLARGGQERQKWQRLEKIYKERKELWKR